MRDKGQGKTAWVDAFEKILVGIYWATGAPVPYAFRTRDGTIRSLDAGCLKMLDNRVPSAVTFQCDEDGFIDTVEPAAPLLDLYLPMKTKLVDRITSSTRDEVMKVFKVE